MVRQRVRPCLRGRSTLVRYADDFVMAFETVRDAERVLAVLGKRFARYGLMLHPDKTRFVDFRPRRPEAGDHPGSGGTTFDFLGFTHVWGKSRQGYDVVRQVTAKNRLARGLAAVNDWCRRHRHLPDLAAAPSSHCDGARPLCLLRHVRQHPTRATYGHELERSGGHGCHGGTTKDVRWSRMKALLQRLPLPKTQHQASLRFLERNSILRTGWQTGTSGSVGGEDGNIPTYPATSRFNRFGGRLLYPSLRSG